MLLQAAKDVANALTDLVNATKNSSGKSASDPAMEILKKSAKVSKPSCLYGNNTKFLDFLYIVWFLCFFKSKTAKLLLDISQIGCRPDPFWGLYSSSLAQFFFIFL